MKKWMILSFSLLNVAFGQLNFDKTRIILDASKGDSQSIVVSNSHARHPYLAQAWIEDENGVKMITPLVAQPALQRLEGRQEKQIRVSLIGNQNNLKQDQESLFSFKVLGMPPKSNEGNNEMVIVITSDLKLFYRPKGLPKYNRPDGWLYEAIIEKSGNGISFKNPTPYHMVFMGYSNSSNGKLKGGDRVIKPFATEKFNMNMGNNFTLYFMGDHGGSVKLKYQCSGSSCQLMD